MAPVGADLGEKPDFKSKVGHLKFCKSPSHVLSSKTKSDAKCLAEILKLQALRASLEPLIHPILWVHGKGVVNKPVICLIPKR